MACGFMKPQSVQCHTFHRFSWKFKPTITFTFAKLLTLIFVTVYLTKTIGCDDTSQNTTFFDSKMEWNKYFGSRKKYVPFPVEIQSSVDFNFRCTEQLQGMHLLDRALILEQCRYWFIILQQYSCWMKSNFQTIPMLDYVRYWMSSKGDKYGNVSKN
jgi:hypothetical protein